MDLAISKNNAPIRLTEGRWHHISTWHPEIADYYFDMLEKGEIIGFTVLNASKR